MLKAYLLFLILIFLSQPVFAQNIPVLHDEEIKARKTIGMTSDWVTCKTSKDCVAIDLPCGPSIGVRTDHKAEAEKAICKAYNCSAGCNGSVMTTPYAICKNGECWADYELLLNH